MSDESQIQIPPSFIALFIPEGRTKPTASRQEILTRYEACEDLATALMDRARTIRWELNITEQDVLVRIHRGLSDPRSAFDAGEAQWITQRLAELLEWSSGADEAD